MELLLSSGRVSELIISQKKSTAADPIVLTSMLPAWLLLFQIVPHRTLPDGALATYFAVKLTGLPSSLCSGVGGRAYHPPRNERRVDLLPPALLLQPGDQGTTIKLSSLLAVCECSHIGPHQNCAAATTPPNDLGTTFQAASFNKDLLSDGPRQPPITTFAQ